MTKIISILLILVCKVGLAQDNNNYWRFMDSVLTETKLVQEIDNDSISALMIFNHIYETGGGIAKGFLVENNIPGGTIDNDLPIPNCYDSCNARMEAYKYSDSLFIIKYKWRGSKTFIADTCYLFRYRGSYMAYPIGIYSEKTLPMVSWTSFYG